MTYDELLTDEIIFKIWEDFHSTDLRTAARFLISNKLYKGRSFLEAICADGGVPVGKIALRCAKHFDSEYYNHLRNDVALQNINAIEHYCEYGWKESTDPSPMFSNDAFLEKALLKTYNINPFIIQYAQLDNQGVPSLKGNQIDLNQFVSLVGQGTVNQPSTSSLFDNKLVNYFRILPTLIHQSSGIKNRFLWLNLIRYSFVILTSQRRGRSLDNFRMVLYLEEKGHNVNLGY